VATLYVKDVWALLDKKSLILRQDKAMYPEIKWILIAGSPCQDLTFAGYLNGLLGLTGKRSMLFL
jgi:site-specific DNA-cytosine methylase